MSRFYKLVDKLAVPVSTREHIAWIASHPQGGTIHVNDSHLTNGVDSVQVSTVFLMGINHRWLEDAAPLLFETMVFGGDVDSAKWRYSTWEEAAKGHQLAIDLVLENRPDLKVTDQQEPVAQRENIPTRFERVITNLCPSQKN